MDRYGLGIFFTWNETIFKMFFWGTKIKESHYLRNYNLLYHYIRPLDESTIVLESITFVEVYTRIVEVLSLTICIYMHACMYVCISLTFPYIHIYIYRHTHVYIIYIYDHIECKIHRQSDKLSMIFTWLNKF